MDGNKRTGALTAINFMNLNGWDLITRKEDNGNTALANVIEKCAASEVGKDELIEWFDQHKVKFEE